MNVEGYIVTCDGYPLKLGTADVLWMHGSGVSTFGTRAMANAAITRTMQYATFHALNWGSRYRVLSLRPALRTIHRKRRR